MTLEINDLKELKNSSLESFEAKIAKADGRSDFNVAAAQLESQLVQLYGFAALTVRRMDDLDQIAGLWSTMVSICDEIAKKVILICEDQPQCIATYDRILDIRNKCERLKLLHA